MTDLYVIPYSWRRPTQMHCLECNMPTKARWGDRFCSARCTQTYALQSAGSTHRGCRSCRQLHMKQDFGENNVCPSCGAAQQPGEQEG